MLVPQSLSLCNIFGVRCALPPSPVAVPRTVYGNDDRRDWYELDYTSAGDAMAGRLLANSIMVHITRADLGAPDSHGIYRILDDYADSLRLGPVRNMCDGQKFLRQPRLGYCSATLVSPTGVITAGHCVPDQKTCDSAAYVFNYYVTGHDAHGDPTFPLITSDDVYFCKSVSTMYATGGTDIAHITLDRPVLGRVPATYRKTLVPTTPGQKLMMIGFPDGMPAKVEAGGTVTDAGRSNGFEFFVASTDSFGGNSGSGIFDADGMMIGVLVRGIKGYVQSGGCTVVYALPGPRGQEEITYVDRAVSLVSASSGHLPATECTDSCVHSNDGECDDGGHGALYRHPTAYLLARSACDHGSDCADCGHRFPSAPPSASPPPAATTSAPPSECTDSCFHARDGECDDGGNGALYSACDHGTDCMDCGERPHASPPPLTPASPSAASGLPASECTDSCVHSNDGECEDGGHGALYRHPTAYLLARSACDHGSDCVDCGHRFPSAPLPHPPQPTPSPSLSPLPCPGVALEVKSDTWKDAASTWMSILELRRKIGVERGIAVIDCIAGDQKVLDALGAAKALFDIEGDAPPDARLSKAAGGHIRANGYSYRKKINLELARIRRVRDLQMRGVALVGTAIAAALISTFNYLYSVADGVEPWWLPPAVVLGVLCVLLPAAAVLVYLYLLHKRKSAGSRLGGGLGHGA
ncbi:hypothetical protein EMIHUDRAFT_465208 [Emiliania huxleyi CCMP1516]|uniref:Serine protease n=2 Tax=Emiliania huxleyi TaxID=2903 RepID=A0A0D3IHD6_EMIH1|nr:hypothetical protein EMIHUDRAFT_465208 [Emiliania huxleyi CCMP1516]EOD10671.1 hypothetical protein EMIHUDRAFT_465208 [Emiliania huxleyi CCMP1516]|eukprot:XP_005763100.1 hypothetical protein EMIHUDRAFT_465208 [Emiliania huxleyi CCMP1516]